MATVTSEVKYAVLKLAVLDPALFLPTLDVGHLIKTLGERAAVESAV